MKDLEKFIEIYKNIFHEDITYKNLDLTNNCIGALNNNQFDTFRRNFIERLQRLSNIFSSDPHSYNELKKKVKDIGHETGYKWSGPYAELVALDYWSSFNNIKDIQFVVKDKVDKMPDSIAKNIGKDELDLDLKFILHFNEVYMDVKSFIPTHIELSDRIIEEVKKKLGSKEEYLLGIEHLRGGNYLLTKKDLEEELKSKKLIDELCNSIQAKKNNLEYTCASGNSYFFRLAYPDQKGRSILFTEDSYDPYLSASNNKYKALEYYKKLLINEPSFIVFVSNPWFNREMIGNLSNSNETFYRSFSRRAFIEFKNDDSIFDIRYPNLLVKNISEKITGIIFIEDESITNKNVDIYKTYIYLNPNCTNTKMTRNDFEILAWGGRQNYPVIIEDFENDNY
jgi:hypothetical protein